MAKKEIWAWVPYKKEAKAPWRMGVIKAGGYETASQAHKRAGIYRLSKKWGPLQWMHIRRKK